MSRSEAEAQGTGKGCGWFTLVAAILLVAALIVGFVGWLLFTGGDAGP